MLSGLLAGMACSSGGHGGTGGSPATGGTGGVSSTGGASATGGAMAGQGGTTAGAGGQGGGVGPLGGAGGTIVAGACVPPSGAVTALPPNLQPAGPVVVSTATRPQLTQAAADERWTIAQVFDAGGMVASSFTSGGLPVSTTAAPLVDHWDPVGHPIGDVSSFTPMFTVAKDGSGNFTSVQAAIVAARAVDASTCARIYILVKPGIYRETVSVANRAAAAPITLYGSELDASKTVIVYDNASLKIPAGATAALGTSGSATFTQNSADFQAKNLTFANDYAETGTGNEQAVALLNQGDRAQYENVRVLGNQDSLYLKTASPGVVGRVYVRDGYIEGDTDFIFGRATAVFDHCEIHTVGTNKTTGTAAAAPSTELTTPYGFLFVSSRFTADGNVVAGGTFFARQWYESSRPQAVGKMIVRNSTVGPHIGAVSPWQPWNGRTLPSEAGDGGVATAAATTPLYTSDAYYALVGGGPVPAEIYLAEYGNSPSAP